MRVFLALGIGAKVGMTTQLGLAHRLAQISPHLVQRHHEAQVVLFAFEDSLRNKIVGESAGALHAEFSTAQLVADGPAVVHVKVGVQQRYIQVLADAGAFAMIKRVTDRGHAMNARHHVTDRHPGQGRSGVGFAAQYVEHPRIGRTDIVIAGCVGQRSGLAEGGNRAHDDPGIDGFDGVVTQAHAGDCSGRKILDEHVDLREQFLDDRLRGGLLQIKQQAFLAAIVFDEGRAPAGLDRIDETGSIAGGTQLDLDYVRAQLDQLIAHRRAGNHVGYVQDLDSVEDMLGFVRRH